ncbi:Radical SAM domain protein [Desulfofarcimen acetoxidans DSM 771]|uniref:Radical SAM domain protein n=1 Tax=Desulfofarcimen acetoxidans (strain ATCC 49208 / DSM 771 / KCTC 5769 / VKM B-1644 / 5575) TaxID=485916 RepID=C8VWB7_DESAS|nr:radical SAM protein [Desulfofarcimen acetoxidans]ACV62469.1 Radical SAM domain protein [Desulfofarcimen acetoxidans DSM 771]
MKLTGLHILLTYRCTFECDHCFVWGSPWQSGTLSLKQLREILRQAEAVGSLEWIYFEGGEPFLFYPVLLEAVREASAAGFRVGIVTNGYWATSFEDALGWLRPFAGLVSSLSVSSDLYHYDEVISLQMKNATQAAERLGLPIEMISIAQPEAPQQSCSAGQPTAAAEAAEKSESGIMYRGRAAENLAMRAAWRSWTEFGECPCEDLCEPGRIHLDPFGYLHVCQGISIGNLFHRPLKEICADYRPNEHPIIGPLLNGGPVELVKRYSLPHFDEYADACHLCYTARFALRERFPETLVPDQMYGTSKF